MLADAAAAAHAALQHLAAAARDAAAYDALIVASLGDAGFGFRGGARVSVFFDEDACVSVWLASVYGAANARIASDRDGPAAASGKQPQDTKR